MRIKNQIRKMAEPVILGYNQVEKTYTVSNQSKTTIFENSSLKKAIRDYSKHLDDAKSAEVVDKKPTGKNRATRTKKSS